MAELELNSCSVRGAIAHGEATVSLQILDVHIFAGDPLSIFMKVGEKFGRFRVGSLMLKQLVLRLAFHIGLACEDEYFDRLYGICG